ncbi:hypothetical protein PIB30_084781 [Stylosanthes scabra]|uniref:Uncharacterized protein n=1 Tax=Stylosanthes scabra TaxID=79078 RepID=A0ABU6QSV8_9FABA|nr:hypothetical protein [Stylosanthes scabra]
MVRTRGRHIDYHQNQQVEEEEEQIQQPENENEAENENQSEEEQRTMHFEATNAGFPNNFGEQQQQGFQQLNEELSNMKIQQMQFFQDMQNTQARYLKELEALNTRQNDLWSQQHHFYNTMRTQQEEMAKEIQEIKKYKVNQTLIQFRQDPIEKMEERIYQQHNEIIEMRLQIKEWTKNTSSREPYCC